MAKPAKTRQGTVLGAQRVSDLDAWKMRIKTAILRSGGNTARAAQMLGISHRHLCRWIIQYPELQRP